MISFSNNNSILGNNISSNSNSGIYLTYSNFNNVTGNLISQNYRGIFLDICNHILIINNLLEENDDIGILIQYGENNNLYGNSIINNIFIGLYFTSSSDYNKIYNNTFDNALNIKNEGLSNSWYFNFLGNNWNDYSGKDANDDGIGDTPYAILGLSGGQDDYPIYWDPPVLQIQDYSVNQTIGIIAPEFQISVIEGISNATWYSIYNGADWSQNYTFTGGVCQISRELWDSLPEGAITIRFYANDSRGYVGFIEVNVIRVLPPDLTGFLIWIIVLIAMAALASIYGIFYTRKSRKRLREKESEIKELGKLKKTITEEDLIISKEKRICLVHKGVTEGISYICPGCGAYYCFKCYEAVKDLENACWSCGHPLDPQKPVKELKKEEKIGISEEDVKTRDIKHK
jgi:parallel beta-helix repeat protein